MNIAVYNFSATCGGVHWKESNGQAVAILSSWAQGTGRTENPSRSMDKVNLSEKLAQFSEQWEPKN
jgi:hypothetical protein